MTDQPMFRDPLGASFRRTLEVQNGLARMAEIHSQPVHSAKSRATRNQEMTKLLEEQARAATEAHEAQSAAGCVRRLEAQIRLFEAELDAAHDVGIRLVNFGSEITFQVTDIGSVEPDLIVFTGKTPEGAPEPISVTWNVISLPKFTRRMPTSWAASSSASKRRICASRRRTQPAADCASCASVAARACSSHTFVIS